MKSKLMTKKSLSLVTGRSLSDSVGVCECGQRMVQSAGSGEEYGGYKAEPDPAPAVSSQARDCRHSQHGEQRHVDICILCR